MIRVGLAALLAAAACGKQTFLAATFVQTPALSNPADQSKPIPQFQVVAAYFGTIDTRNPTQIDASKVATINDATAQIAFHHKPASANGTDVEEDRVLDVKSGGDGSYTLSSQDNDRLTFEQTPYTLILTTSGTEREAFGARMTPGPTANMVEFKDAKCITTVSSVSFPTDHCMDLAAGSGLHITRDDTPAAGQTRPPAFVLVGRIDPNNPSAEPQITFKTIPADATSLLKYVLGDGPYRWSEYDIPATAFPQSGTYVVTLLTARTGKVSENAFLGSVAIAASGSAGIVRIQ